MILSCSSNTEDNYTPKKEVETVPVNLDTNNLDKKNYLEKLRTKELLNNEEFDELTSFMLNNNDASMMEEVGNRLYEYFLDNDSLKNAFTKYLYTKKEKEKHSILLSVVDFMSIDLLIEEYDYEQLIKTFPFLENKSVKKRFNQILSDNQDM